MARERVSQGEVKQSIRDLTRIYKPKSKHARSFVEWFVKRYNVQKGYENELTTVVLEELQSMNQEDKQS